MTLSDNISPQIRALLLKDEVIKMRLDGVFPAEYKEEFFKRFPDMATDIKNVTRLVEVMNIRSADEKIINCLRKWYHELKNPSRTQKRKVA